MKKWGTLRVLEFYGKGIKPVWVDGTIFHAEMMKERRGKNTNLPCQIRRHKSGLTEVFAHNQEPNTKQPHYLPGNKGVLIHFGLSHRTVRLHVEDLAPSRVEARIVHPGIGRTFLPKSTIVGICCSSKDKFDNPSPIRMFSSKGKIWIQMGHSYKTDETEGMEECKRLPLKVEPDTEMRIHGFYFEDLVIFYKKAD